MKSLYEKNHLIPAIFGMLFWMLGTNYPYLRIYFDLKNSCPYCLLLYFKKNQWSVHMLFNVLCQQTDKKALSQNSSFNFEKRIKECECHSHIHNPLKKWKLYQDSTKSWWEPPKMKVKKFSVVSWESEVTPSATPFFKRAYKISHPPWL